MTFVSSLAHGKVASTLLDAGAVYGTHYPIQAIAGGDAKTNARILMDVLAGTERGAYRAAAIENAAAAILVGGLASTYEEAMARAVDSVDSGRAFAKLRKMLEVK